LKKSEQKEEQKLVFKGALYFNSLRSNKWVLGLTKKEEKIISPSIFKARGRGSGLDQIILAVERYNIAVVT
jgi:activator of 2-hydroxyglutaryl-CoA dehydratase